MRVISHIYKASFYNVLRYFNLSRQARQTSGVSGTMTMTLQENPLISALFFTGTVCRYSVKYRIAGYDNFIS
jgi:hypothetical protein